ncbi:MAG: arsenic resistance N-acetyltransferase ArsN2 [Gemmatimonadetes bacterium]|nr:arsenic resistance N-acetyltransferase ArsN2 [Gemmatimonadota bacterium]
MTGTDTVPSGQDGRATIRGATAADAVAVRALLTGAQLPLDGVPDDLAHFLVAEQDGTVVGAIGLEPFGEAALLRSAVVAPAVRGTGLGERLVRALLAAATASGTRELVLLTTTADAWFPRFGFERIAREAAPVALHASEEFRGACPASAVVMRLRV